MGKGEGAAVMQPLLQMLLQTEETSEMNDLVVEEKPNKITVARKGQLSYNLYFCRTNFIFFGQLLYLWDKLNILCTNFIFLSQTLYFWHNLYISHTNFLFPAQTLYFPHKLYISGTNFILVAQSLFYISRTNFIFLVQT